MMHAKCLRIYAVSRRACSSGDDIVMTVSLSAQNRSVTQNYVNETFCALRSCADKLLQY